MELLWAKIALAVSLVLVAWFTTKDPIPEEELLQDPPVPIEVLQNEDLKDELWAIPENRPLVDNPSVCSDHAPTISRDPEEGGGDGESEGC